MRRPEPKKVKQPKINVELCEGCATCEAICPRVFKLGEDGKSYVIPNADFENNVERIQDAIDSCPTRAISWEE